MNPPVPLTLFYDGLCPLCSREIAHYRRRAGAETIRFVDITDPGFDAAGQGLDARAVHRVLHVKLGDEVRTGLEAFIAVWGRLRAYRWLSRLASIPGLHALLNLAYRAFAVVRPLLPRRKASCATGTCQR